MLSHDVQYAIRGFMNAKRLTAVIVLSLVIGIGVNTAVFSIVNSLLLQPLPYRDSGKLVAIYNPNTSSGKTRLPFSPQDFDDFARESGSYESLASYLYIPGMSGIDLTGMGEPQRLTAAYVSGQFFNTLGVAAERGRILLAADAQGGDDRQIVISDRVWRSTFSADPAIIGRTVTLSQQTYTVVGIMPRSFQFPASDVDVWAPLSLIGNSAIPHHRGLRWMDVIARLRPGVSLEGARSEATLIMQRLARDYPDTNANTASIEMLTLRDAIIGDLRTVVLIIFGIVAFVLLIACANIANLLLARSTEREKELAIRSAIGASPRRLVVQALVESMVLSITGGVLGIVAAVVSLRMLAGMSNRAGEIIQQVQLDYRVFLFAAAISIVTGLIFGLLPALRASKAEPQLALSQSSRSSEGRETRSARSLLVAGEIAVAATVLIASLLAVQSLWRLLRVDPGLTTEHVVAVKLRIPESHLKDRTAAMNYRNELVRSIASLPGVVAVGGGKTMPLTGGAEPYSISGLAPGATNPRAEIRSGVLIVTPGYFHALKIPIVAGREFTDADEQPEAKAPVVIVNEKFAHANWPGENPIGKNVYFGKNAIQVIGVAADVHDEGLAAPVGPMVYGPAGFFPRSSLHLFVRTSQDPLALAGTIRSAIWQVDKDEPVEITTLDDVLATSTAQPRMIASLLGAFGAIALLLAGIGVYGMLAYNVRRKLHDIGVRIALGARPSDVVRLVLGESLRLTVAGLAMGTAAAFIATRVMRSVLYGIAPFDPITYISAIGVLLAVALTASALPTARALRIDPVIALRSE